MAITSEQLQSALDRARSDPNSAFSNELRSRIETGRFDEQLSELGIQRTAGGLKRTDAVAVPRISDVSREAPTVERIATITGGRELAKGIGESVGLLGGGLRQLRSSAKGTEDTITSLVSEFNRRRDAGEDTEDIRNQLQNTIETSEGILSELRDIEDRLPTTKQTLGSALNLAANFVPLAKGSLASKVATGAAAGAAVDVGSALEEERRFTPVGTGIGAGIPVLGPVLARATRAIGTKLKDLPGISKMLSNRAEKLEEVSQRLLPKDRLLLKSRDADINKFNIDNKITGTPEQRLDKVSSILDDFETQVQTKIEGSPFTLNKAEVIRQLESLPETNFLKKGAEDVESLREAERVVKNLVEDLNTRFPEQLDAQTMNGLKRNFDANAFSTRGDRVVSEPRKAIADFFRKQVHENIDELKDINEEYSTAILSKDILERAVGRQQIGIVARIASTIAASSASGLIGGAIGGPVAAAGASGVGIVLAQELADILFGTASRTARAKILNNLSKSLDTIDVPDTKKALENLVDRVNTVKDTNLTRAAFIRLISDRE